jgi:hypothetical protein
LGKFGKGANAPASALSGGTEDIYKLKVENEKLKIFVSQSDEEGDMSKAEEYLEKKYCLKRLKFWDRCLNVVAVVLVLSCAWLYLMESSAQSIQSVSLVGKVMFALGVISAILTPCVFGNTTARFNGVSAKGYLRESDLANLQQNR